MAAVDSRPQLNSIVGIVAWWAVELMAASMVAEHTGSVLHTCYFVDASLVRQASDPHPHCDIAVARISPHTMLRMGNGHSHSL